MRFAVRTETGKYCCCDAPERTITAHDADSFRAAIAEIEYLQSEGYYLAGWISFEAAAAIDSRLPVNSGSVFPILTMLASRSVVMRDLPEFDWASPPALHPSIDQSEYEERCQQLLNYILAGDVYQANFSFRCGISDINDPFQLFCQLQAEHPVPHAAYIETDDWQVVSLSPESFLERDGDRLVSEPMKGTAPRRLTFEEDEQERMLLAEDTKNRAENIMIVDLMRNDLGRICETGSIYVPYTFKPIRFHSLHQLVSRVEGQLRPNTSLMEILAATFPAGSITGAPKVRAMEIIAELEKGTRKAYTGSVGLFKPGGDFSLNVAIRTLTCNRREGRAELGIGSGVVANSKRRLEWQECLLKGQFLSYRQLHQEIFETLLWNGAYVWLDAHLDRLQSSCAYWLVPFNRAEATAKLGLIASKFTAPRQRVRLAVLRSGELVLSATELSDAGWGRQGLVLMLGEKRVDPMSPYQYHKTDFRELYDNGFAACRANNYDEVLFLNSREELAECAISNLFVKIDNRWLTPPISCGVLPGVWRSHQMQTLEATETVLSLTDLAGASEVVIGNSVRMDGRVKEIWSNGSILWQEVIDA